MRALIYACCFLLVFDEFQYYRHLPTRQTQAERVRVCEDLGTEPLDSMPQAEAQNCVENLKLRFTAIFLPQF